MTPDQLLAAKREFGKQNQAYLGYSIDRAADGVVEAHWFPPEAFGNPYGFVHGGFVSVIVDELGGRALSTLLKTPASFPTVSLHVDYLRGVPLGEPARVVAKVARAGRRISFVEVEIFDNAGQRCTRGQLTFSVQPEDDEIVGFSAL